MSRKAICDHPGESVLDVMSAIREGKLFALQELVIPFYNAQKDIAKSTYNQHKIYSK